MSDNLNAQPLIYDFRRVRYLPEHIFDCGHCQQPLESFTSLMLKPGHFHHPGSAALLCERCTDLFWREEERIDQQAADR